MREVSGIVIEILWCDIYFFFLGLVEILFLDIVCLFGIKKVDNFFMFVEILKFVIDF